MKSAIILKDKIRRGDLTLGILLCNLLSLEMLEIAIATGLDYVIIDLEHLTHDATLVADACRMGRMTNFPVLIRPARTDMETVRLTADLGPCGLMLPMIESPEQLDTVRDGLWMPPRGQRRPGGHGNWWVANYNYATWRDEVENHFVVLPQIESPRGLENATKIAGHEITTALAVGPYDLSARLGVCWEPAHPKLQDAMQHLRKVATAAGKPMWRIGDATVLRQEGFHFLCIAEPMNLLRATLANMVKQSREGKGADPAKAFVP